MAENGDRSPEDLTEEASPYKLEEMRQKGQVSQSRELTGLLALIAGAITLTMTSSMMGEKLQDFMREVFRTDLSARADLGSITKLGLIFTKAGSLMLILGLPVGVAGFVVGIIVSYAQVGSIFSGDPIQPDMSKIDPLKGFGRLFSKKMLTEGIRFLLKAVAMALVAYTFVKTAVLHSGMYASDEPGLLMGAFATSAKDVFWGLISVLVVFAIADFVLQRWEFSKSVRQTKQEAREEMKEREGDPALKARIRSIQREMSRRRMMAAVKKADVIITNPTHIAIAIQYDNEKMAAPRVVAKGADLIAQRIKQIALEAGIPCVENVPLARTLYKTVKLNQQVPRALYQAVAEVLAYVFRLRKKEYRT